jgi:hypothetical protein
MEENINREGVEDLEKQEEKEFRNICLKYKNRIGKLLLMVDPSNREEFFNILKENFVQMESKWTIDRLFCFVHTKVNAEKKVSYLKIRIKDDMEKSAHGFPSKLTGNTHWTHGFERKHSYSN